MKGRKARPYREEVEEIGIGRKLQRIRQQKNLRSEDVAKSLGISKSGLANIECDRQFPTLRLLYTLANFYKIDPSYLLQQEPDMRNTADSAPQPKSALARLQQENERLKKENSSVPQPTLAFVRLQEENELLRKENAKLKRENRKLSEDNYVFKLATQSDRALVKQNEELFQMLEDAIAAKDMDVLETYKKRLIDYVQAIEITCSNGVQEKHALMLLICNGTRACRKYLQQLREAKLRKESA